MEALKLRFAYYSILLAAALALLGAITGSIFDRIVMQGNVDSIVYVLDFCLVLACTPIIIITRSMAKIIKIVQELELKQDVKKEDQ